LVDAQQELAEYHRDHHARSKRDIWWTRRRIWPSK
jgi:hypothetical protein